MGLPSGYDWRAIESAARAFWRRLNLGNYVWSTRPRRRVAAFIEGPPTLNGYPHMGHVRGRAIKDLWFRFMALKGHRVLFRAGWDCQGLPVELEAERELGVKGGKQELLQRVGMEGLVAASKALLQKYRAVWEEVDELLGLSLDRSRAYWTYLDEYMEREWQYIRRAWEAGLIGEGYRVVAYCPSCMTALSQAEVAQGYEELEDPSLYYKVRLEDGAFAIVWTTMPFTLVTDELLAVHPDEYYVYVRSGDEVWVLAEKRLAALSKALGVKEEDVAKRVKGSELEGLRYEHPLIDQIKGLAELRAKAPIHRVVAEEFVDVSTGTGIVHLSPANGEEDFEVARSRGLPVFSPFDDRASFTEEAGAFAGLFCRDADEKVVEMLRARKSLVRLETIRHEYPTCWRSHHRLVWLARREYFYWMDRIRDRLVAAGEGVQYFYEPPRNRFLEFLRQAAPWCISRERVWGTPLPVWACERCGHKNFLFSRSQIVRRALELPDGEQFELHRPWIDRVLVACERCGGPARREPFVLDTWHNSGAAPYASLSDEEFRRYVPADFLVEGIDQTRGWAYSLLALHVLYTGEAKSPYRSFLFYGLVLDEQGRKMSKSLGNVIDARQVLSSSPADVLRFYLAWKASPAEAISFSAKEMWARPYQVINTLYNLHVFFQQNSRLDGYDPSLHTLQWALGRKELRETERWLLAKVNRTIREVEFALSSCRHHEAAKALERCVIDVLSQGYIPMVRHELWDDSEEGRPRRLVIFSCLGHALEVALKLLHPISPFVTEYLYQEVFAARPWEAPLLDAGWPAPLRGLALAGSERAVDLVLRVLSLANSLRARAGLKRRWPLGRLVILAPGREARLLTALASLVEALTNVKRAEIVSTPERFPARLALRPDPGKLGAAYRAEAPIVIAALRAVTGRRAWKAWLRGSGLSLKAAAKEYSVSWDQFGLEVEPAEGFAAIAEEGLVVALETKRDRQLIAEGLLRDVARRIQALRKERGYDPAAVLERAMVAGLDEEALSMLRPLADRLAFLVRAKRVEFLRQRTEEAKWKEEEVEEQRLYIAIE